MGFSERSNEDYAYLRCARILEGKSMTGRADRARDIVDFLNQWGCRVRRMDATHILAPWIREHADRREALATIRLIDDAAVDAADEVADLYDDLLSTGKTAIHNWSDAATSKALHQLLPAFPVLYRRHAREGRRDAEPHRVHDRLARRAPAR